jgi:hypothetical protein
MPTLIEEMRASLGVRKTLGCRQQPGDRLLLHRLRLEAGRSGRGLDGRLVRRAWVLR